MDQKNPADMTPDFTGPELCRLEAHEVVALLKKGEVSPRELLDAAFARIAEVEPVVNAMPTLCEERARAAAKKVAANRDGNGSEPGWLGGLPIGIKDLMPVKGVRTTFGTIAYKDFTPAESDPLVEKLEARGGIVVGKTNTPEMGAGANTFNAVFGTTRNPWNPALTCGGSSGGSAVALACGTATLDATFTPYSGTGALTRSSSQQVKCSGGGFNPGFTGGTFPYAYPSEVTAIFATPGTYHYTDPYVPESAGTLVVQ